MYAIFQAKGKQFRAEQGARLRMPSIDAEPGERITFDEVLLGENEGGDVVIGRPAVEGASVAAEIVGHGKYEKIVVFKMKRRKGYRKKQGHRQKFTEVRVIGIDLGGAGTEATATAAEVGDAEVEATTTEELDATATARELAEEHGIELAAIDGTGKDGRILKADVEKAIRARDAEE